MEPTLEEQLDEEVRAMEEHQITELLSELEQPVEGDELNIHWVELQALNLVEGTLNDYLTVDDELATGGTRSLAEIAADVLTKEVEEPEAER